MSLYANLLGPAFERLPRPLQQIHARQGCATYRGEVVVTGATGALGRLCGAAARLPARYAGPIEVEIVAKDTMEQWTRRFGPHAMCSVLRECRGFLRERLGLVTLDFALCALDSNVRWRVARVRVCGVPLPVRWFGGVDACESADGSRYGFDVKARLPGIGMIVHYRGWLAVD